MAETTVKTYDPAEARDASGKWTEEENPPHSVLRAIKEHTAAGGADAWRYSASDADRQSLKDWVNTGVVKEEVHRGLGFSEQEWTNKFESGWTESGTVIDLDKRVTSYSTDRSRVAGYGSGQQKVILTIESGSKGRDISKHSVYKEEKEVLLAPQSYKVVSSDYKQAGGIWLIRLKPHTAHTKSLNIKSASYTNADFEDFLSRCRDEGFLSPEEVADLRARRLHLVYTDFPLPLDEGIPDDLTEEDVRASKRRLGVLLLVALAARARRRDEMQNALEGRLRALATTSSTSSVRAWQAAMRDGITAHILDQAMLGRGAAVANHDPAPDVMEHLNDVIQEQTARLSRFADYRAARSLVGRPLSPEYLAARAALYTGQGRAEWFKGAEESAAETDDGWVVDYIANDDASTCAPCKQAERDSPYLPSAGAFPGEVCEGRGRCRCERQLRYSPGEARALGGYIDLEREAAERDAVIRQSTGKSYNPSEKRDEHGRWADEVPGSASGKIKKIEMTGGKAEQHAEVRGYLDGVPPKARAESAISSIVFHSSAATGVHAAAHGGGTTLGVYDLQKIHLYPGYTRQVVLHEYGHSLESKSLRKFKEYLTQNKIAVRDPTAVGAEQAIKEMHADAFTAYLAGSRSPLPRYFINRYGKIDSDSVKAYDPSEPRDKAGKWTGRFPNLTDEQSQRYYALATKLGLTDDEDKELRALGNLLTGGKLLSGEDVVPAPTEHEIAHAKKVLRAIAGDPEALRMAAALSADGGSDDVANVTEHLFSADVVDAMVETDDAALNKIFSAYLEAVGDEGYYVNGGVHGKPSPARLKWERKWYGKEVGGISKGVRYAEKYLANFTASKKSYDPNEARDEAGKWTSSGAVAWKPTMTPEEADEWAKDSAVKGVYEHTTTPENAEKIREEGFKLHANRTAYYGQGVYLSKDKGSAFYGKEALEVRANVKNPYIHLPLPHETTQSPLGRLSDSPLKKELEAELARDPTLQKSAAVTRILKRMGYDSVISREDEDILVVFDPKDVTVVKR